MATLVVAGSFPERGKRFLWDPKFLGNAGLSRTRALPKPGASQAWKS